jgi:hypothetical protein
LKDKVGFNAFSLIFAVAFIITMAIMLSRCDSAYASSLLILVKDDADKPVIGATVSLRKSDGAGRWPEVEYCHTNVSGLVAVFGLEEDQPYFLRVEAPNHLTMLYDNKFSFEIPDLLYLRSGGNRVIVRLSPIRPPKGASPPLVPAPIKAAKN